MNSTSSIRPPLEAGLTPSLPCLDPLGTAAALPYTALVDEIEKAACQLRDGQIMAPERTVLPLATSGTLLCMPAVAPDIGVTKLLTVHPHNGENGRKLKTIQGELIVFRAEDGQRLALLDGPTLTARRTAAVTIVGLRALASRSLKSVLLIGAGEQARAHLEALVETFGVRRFCIASPHGTAAIALARSMMEAHSSMEIETADAFDLPRSEVDAADAIITLTTANRPVIPANIADSTIVVGVGAYRPDMAEIPPGVIRHRRVVVDHLQSARAEAGDLIQAAIDWNRVEELANVLARATGTTQFGPTIFKTVGHAAWDLAAARVAVRHLGLTSSC